MIGNGFDRNLGLQTKYSDFIVWYKETQPKTDTLRNFRKHIKENVELWSAAEEELGNYTAQFESGEGDLFYECHRDICEYLACYLKHEQKKLKVKCWLMKLKRRFHS